MEPRERIIVALDMQSIDAVRQLVDMLGERVTHYKVGLELFYSHGARAIEFLKSRDKKVFLDLKLHDIPNTVSRAAEVLTGLGVDILNVHASGGPVMMRAVAATVAETAARINVARPKVIAVTVLTSIDAGQYASIGYSRRVDDQVVTFAAQARDAGMDGVVASPQETAAIRARCGEGFLLVIPGIRPTEASLNDQSRIATPQAALVAGADYLVIGRPITAAPDPAAAASRILAEISG